MKFKKVDPDACAVVGHQRPIDHYISHELGGSISDLQAHALHENYGGGYRMVRRGEDSYYRAVMYAYLEQLILLGPARLQAFANLLSSSSALFNISGEKDPTLESHLQHLINARRNHGKQAALLFFFNAVNGANPSLDHAMVRFLRRVIWNFFRHHGSDKNFLGKMSLKQMVEMCVNPDYAEFLCQTVLGDGKDAVEPIFKVVPLALGIAVNVVVVNQDKRKELLVQEFKPGKDNGLGLHDRTICVILSSGQYQIVYPKVIEQYDGGVEDAKVESEEEEIKVMDDDVQSSVEDHIRDPKEDGKQIGRKANEDSQHVSQLILPNSGIVTDDMEEQKAEARKQERNSFEASRGTRWWEYLAYISAAILLVGGIIGAIAKIFVRKRG